MDATTQAASTKLVRQIYKTPPLSWLTTRETIPSFGAVPDPNNDGGSDADWKQWVKGIFGPVAHPVGTCAMMRQELGGVVDGRLRIYGTRNVRLIDAGTMPTQVSAHLSSTPYGIAEKAADKIKSGQ